MSTYLPTGYDILQLKWWQGEMAVPCGLVLIGHAATLYLFLHFSTHALGQTPLVLLVYL